MSNPSPEKNFLKTFLLHLPHRHQYDFTDAAKIDLRRALYFALSDNGTQMNLFFPEVERDRLPTDYMEVVMPKSGGQQESQEFYIRRPFKENTGHPNRSCGRKFKKGEPIYRCVTCGQDESSGLCLNCFDEEAHQDHDIIATICQREFGGVCDCGDPEAWKTEIRCKHYELEETPEEAFPETFRDAIFQTIQIALDYLVDVMAGSRSLITKDHDDSSSIVDESLRSTLLLEKYHGRDWNTDKFYLLLYNDQNKQYRDAVQRIALATKKVEDFSTMIADEVNTNGRAKVIGSTQIDSLLDSKKILEATGLTSCIKGAREIFREEMCTEIVLWLIDITSESIGGNFNMARNMLLKAICSPWNTGVSCYPVPETNGAGFLNYDKIPNVSRSFLATGNIAKSENWDFTPSTWNIDEELAEECHYDKNFSFNGQDRDSFHGSRFQYLLFFEIRYWRSFRVHLHNLFNSVLSASLRYRPLICCQYVDMYPMMLELFFLYDREPENSCMTSLNQLLTPSNNATMVAEHGDLTSFLAAAFSFVTTLQVKRPVDVDTSLSLAPNAFKNRKLGQVFFDTCCVLLKSKNAETILTEKFIHQICDILQLFQGRPTLKREAVEHVEYESNDYGVYFNMFSVVSSLSEMVAKLFGKVDISNSSHLIALAIKRLFTLLKDSNMKDDKCDISPLSLKQIETIDGPKLITQFKVHENPVSFLHPLHSFLTWIIQYSKIHDIKELYEYGNLDIDDEIVRYLIEHPLRNFVLLSQIKVGFWVRNGFSIRTQLHIYKSSGIRESGFRRDLFMLQFLSSVGDPDLILSTIFSRWSLLPWLREDNENNEDYDATILPLMVEECLQFFIHLFTETGYCEDPYEAIDNRLSTEIIHILCFQPLTYSKLCNEISDFLVHEKRFDLILKSVADYIPPSSHSQSGIYKLKPKYFEKVDPFYLHYNSNKREDAEKLLKERISAKSKVPVKDTVIPPRPVAVERTIFQNIFNLTSSKTFIQFLKSTLKYVHVSDASKTETMLGFTLHLIHTAVKGDEATFSRKFGELIWSELTNDHNEPFFYESVGSLLFKILQNDDFAAHHSKVKAIFKTLKEKDKTIDGYLKEQVEGFDVAVLGADFMSPPPTAASDFETKKRLAKERRDKIMAKFKKQQTQFVEKNSTEDDDEDIDGDMETENMVGWKYPEEHCILCQMPKGPDDIFGVVFNALPSSCFRTVPFDNKYWTLKAFESANHPHNEEEDKLEEYFNRVRDKHVVGPGFPGNQSNCTKTNAVASSCGHGMHYSCYENYLASTRGRQTQITRTVPEDFENLEFICPLCKSLGNLFVPILWNCNTNSLKSFVSPDEDEWHKGFDTLRFNSFSDDDAVNELTDAQVSYVTKTLRSHYKTLFFQNEIPKMLSEISLKITRRISELSQTHFREYLTKLISSTIGATEISLRGVDLGNDYAICNLPNQTLTTLRTLVEFKKTWFAIVAHNQQSNGYTNGYTVKVVDEALGKLSYLASDKVFEVFDDVDFFDFLVSCIATKDISNNSIHRMCYTEYVIQIVATLLAQLKEKSFNGDIGLFDLEIPDITEETRFNIMTIARKIRDNHPVFDNLSDEIFEDERLPNLLYELLEKSVTPFLRKTLIWSLASCADNEGTSLDSETEDFSEADRIAKFLNLPTIAELLSLLNESESFELSKLNGFTQYIQTTDNDLRFQTLEFPGQVRLVDIPKRLDDIFTKILYAKNEVKPLTYFDPAVCLFCGKFVNLQKSSLGESKGECNRHYEDECSNDFGIFLLPKHGAILLLHKGNGSFHPTPYIDSHGELDSDARHGQIMTLSEEKYDEFIRQMWLRLGVPNYVTRKLEGTLDIGGWETL